MFKFTAIRLLKINYLQDQNMKVFLIMHPQPNSLPGYYHHSSFMWRNITHHPRQHFFWKCVPPAERGKTIMFRYEFFQDFFHLLSSPISLPLFLWIHQRAFFSISIDGHFVQVSILIIFVSIFSFFLVLSLYF